jgi:hypothetical protein
VMPLKIAVAIASAAAFTTSLTMNLMGSIVPRIPSHRIAPR